MNFKFSMNCLGILKSQDVEKKKNKIFSCNLHKRRKYHHFNKSWQKYGKFTLPLNLIKREMNYYKRGLVREQYKALSSVLPRALHEES